MYFRSFSCFLAFEVFLAFEAFLFLFLKMLVILAVFPVASPSESLCLEEAVAEVAFFNHVNMMLAAVEIGACRGWLHHILAVFQPFVIRVIERVDIDGKSLAVLRNGMGMRDEAEVEAG